MREGAGLRLSLQEHEVKLEFSEPIQALGLTSSECRELSKQFLKFAQALEDKVRQRWRAESLKKARELYEEEKAAKERARNEPAVVTCIDPSTIKAVPPSKTPRYELGCRKCGSTWMMQKGGYCIACVSTWEAPFPKGKRQLQIAYAQALGYSIADGASPLTPDDYD